MSQRPAGPAIALVLRALTWARKLPEVGYPEVFLGPDLAGDKFPLLISRARLLATAISGESTGHWGKTARGRSGIDKYLPPQNGCAQFCVHPQLETIANGSKVARTRVLTHCWYHGTLVRI